MIRNPHPPTRQHNFLPKLVALIASGRIPGGAVSDVYVRHDPWCDIGRDRFGNCDPEIHLEAPMGAGAPRWQEAPA